MSTIDDFREEARRTMAETFASFGPSASFESTLMCMHEWHDENQDPDDFHHCTRSGGHTGPHTCGWCEGLERGA